MLSRCTNSGIARAAPPCTSNSPYASKRQGIGTSRKMSMYIGLYALQFCPNVSSPKTIGDISPNSAEQRPTVGEHSTGYTKVQNVPDTAVTTDNNSVTKKTKVIYSLSMISFGSYTVCGSTFYMLSTRHYMYTIAIVVVKTSPRHRQYITIRPRPRRIADICLSHAEGPPNIADSKSTWFVNCWPM